MDMDVRRPSKQSKRLAFPEDLYASLVAIFFRACHLTIVDVCDSNEAEQVQEHRHAALDRVPHIVHLSRTCRCMRDEVRKNAKLDRTRAWDLLFRSLFGDVLSCWAGEWTSGSQRQEYTLKEHPFPFDRGRYDSVAYLCIKRTPSKLEILFQCATATCSDAKVVFRIVDPDGESDSESDSDSGSDSGSDGFPDELLSVKSVLEMDLATVANAWLATRRDSRIAD